MRCISQSVEKKDHKEKMNGSAKYIADLKFDHMLHAKVLRSTKAHAIIKSIKVPALDEGYEIIDYKDVPGINLLKVVTSEQPIFAEDEVRYIGEPILMVVGPDEAYVNEIIAHIEVIYEDQEAVLTLTDATDDVAHYSYTKGEPDEAFRKATTIFAESFETGYQEQAYIEPQGAIACCQGEKVTIYGSMQCPYYVKGAVEQALGLESSNVQIIQATTGGGFGGKEDYPSLISAQVAVAAYKLKMPIRLILNRREDMAVTPKRHPAYLKYRVALDEAKNIIGIEADIKLNAGAYAGLSSVVLQRSLIAATGVYNIPHIKVSGRAMLTNTVPNGAYRGFGAPQSFFAIESLMVHLAKHLGITPLAFKKQYIVKQGDTTATNGKFHHPIKMMEMLDKIEEMSHFSEKYEVYSKGTGRFRKGIGMALFLHGCGFTGSAERDLIKSVVKLVKYEDDTIEILASNAEIGQGLKTTFSKIVAEVIGCSIDQIKMLNPDTDRVPNSGPTVASRSLMIVGKLLERAAARLKENWQAGKLQEIEEHYKSPDMIPWDMETFSGDAYPTYSWGINVVEVEVDLLIGTSKILGVWGVFDVGNAIDTTIMKGQMEGGMLQGLGYGAMEKMENINGRISQASMTDYIIPTAKDTTYFGTALVDNPYDGGPFGAKGAGELTLIGTAPSYAAAVEQAIGKAVNVIPITPEKIMDLLEA